MNSFRECQKLETASREHLQEHLLRELVYDGRYVRIEKGPMAKEFQLTSGDYVWNSDELTAWRVEHKCEYANKYGNFFLETFSNKKWGKLGWFYTNGADFLLYHFMRDGEVYLLSLSALRAWAYGQEREGTPRIHKYREKPQDRYEQLNDTWGYCVRIEDVKSGMQVKCRTVPQLYLDDYEARLDLERSVRNNGQSELWDSGPRHA